MFRREDMSALGEEIHGLIGDWERNVITSLELQDGIMRHLRTLPSAERHAALEALSAHASEDMRRVALEFQIFERHDALSRNLDYVRQNSPLRPGRRLELFGGYDYYETGGKPRWLNGRDCYRATFLGFVSCGENAIAAALVELDEVIEVPGHTGRYGILLPRHIGLDSFAWGLMEDTVAVYVAEAPPEEMSFIRWDRASAAALETHATYRVEETT
jgi:hypothetical protein